MKVLTVRDPRATAIAEYGKSPENRSWRTHYRGPLAIHGGLGYDKAGARDPRVIRHLLDAAEAKRGTPLPSRAHTEWYFGEHGIGPEHFEARGKVLGVAQLVGVHHARDCKDGAGLCSPWAMDHMWHWVLTDFRALADPIEARGRQGLWTPAPDLAAELDKLVDAPTTAAP